MHERTIAMTSDEAADLAIEPAPVSSGDPSIWVSVVHWNGGESTMACLDSIFADPVRGVSVVVVDNGSTDDVLARIVARWPSVVVVSNATNLGFTGGHNQAIALAMERGADYVMLLNQDATLLPGCIRQMTAQAEGDPRIGLLSPVVFYADEPSRVQSCGLWIDFDRVDTGGSRDPAVMRAFQASEDAQVVLWGTALMLRRGLIEQIGMLDDRLFAYYEDMDLSVRSMDAGWLNRVCFEAGALHEGHRTRYTRESHVFYLSSRNALLFWRKALVVRRRRWRSHWKAVAKILNESGTLQDAGLDAQAAACIDGLWAGWRRHYGPYESRIEAPRWVRSILLSHPYFWSRVTGGQAVTLVRERMAARRT